MAALTTGSVHSARRQRGSTAGVAGAEQQCADMGASNCRASNCRATVSRHCTPCSRYRVIRALRRQAPRAAPRPGPATASEPLLGVKLRTAVDGSASSDSSHVAGERCPALPPQDLKTSRPQDLETLKPATLGGVRVRGGAIGALVPGYIGRHRGGAARRLGLASAHHDPLAALMFCHAPCLHYSSVNGRAAMRDGRLATLQRSC